MTKWFFYSLIRFSFVCLEWRTAKGRGVRAARLVHKVLTCSSHFTHKRHTTAQYGSIGRRTWKWRWKIYLKRPIRKNFTSKCPSNLIHNHHAPIQLNPIQRYEISTPPSTSAITKNFIDFPKRKIECLLLTFARRMCSRSIEECNNRRPYASTIIWHKNADA